MPRIDLEAIAARHTEWREPPRNPADPKDKPVRPECNYCEPRWPCDASLLVARVRELEAAGFETLTDETTGKVSTLCRACHIVQGWDEYPTGHVPYCWLGQVLNS